MSTASFYDLSTQLEGPPMKHLAISLFTLTLLLPTSTSAQQEESYDYWQPQRAMVQRGQQAVF
ncbi:MAG: hypothetical protein IIC59_09460, partial [Proteobacteria bacterium]|nr:hypothetical protein [Pseudomonadota bacterium]